MIDCSTEEEAIKVAKTCSTFDKESWYVIPMECGAFRVVCGDELRKLSWQEADYQEGTIQYLVQTR